MKIFASPLKKPNLQTKPNAVMKKKFSTFVLLLHLLFPFVHPLHAQELNGEVITISENMLTILKFNKEIKDCRFGDRKGYTFQVRDNDNSVAIKSSDANPGSTNLIVVEGDRTHNFIIQFQRNVDLNKVRLYYDYSNLKELKKYVGKQNSSIQAPVLAMETEKRVAVETPKAEEKKESPVESDKERKAREKKETQQKKEQEKISREKEKAAQLEKDRIAALEAALAEKEKQAQEAAEAKRKQESEEASKAIAAKKQKEKEEREFALAESKRKEQERKEQEELLKKEKEAQRKAEKEKRDAELAAILEQQRQKALDEKKKAELKKQEQELAAKELAAKKQKEKEDAEAALAEKKRRDAETARIKAEEKRIEQERIAEEQRLLAEKKRQEKEEADRKLAAEKERMREQERLKKLEAEQKLAAQKRVDSVRKRYSHAGLFNAYPGIALQDPPMDQQLAADFYLSAENTQNKLAVEQIFAKPSLAQHVEAEPVDEVKMTLKGIHFSGVNAYYLIEINNDSEQDFLTGVSTVAWYKYRDSSGAYLRPVYMASKSIARDSVFNNAVKEYAFPVIPPHQTAWFVIATRAVNTNQDGQFAIQIQDRKKKKSYAIYFDGRLYNEEMNRLSRFK